MLGSDDPADCSGCYERFDAKGLEGSQELVDGGIGGEGDKVDGRERHVDYANPIEVPGCKWCVGSQVNCGGCTVNKVHVPSDVRRRMPRLESLVSFNRRRGA